LQTVRGLLFICVVKLRLAFHNSSLPRCQAKYSRYYIWSSLAFSVLVF